MDDKSRDQLSGQRSEPRVLLGQKRSIKDSEEAFNGSHKKVKIRDLRSVLCSEAQAQRGEKMKNVHPEKVHSDTHSGSRTLDLNVNIGSESTVVCSDIDESNNLSKGEVKSNYRLAKAKGLDLDLNVEDNSCSINDIFYPYKNCHQLKSREESDCGSSVGALDEKDSMTVWKGLKRNNYMSALYGAVPRPLPKARGRKKSNDDAMKRKIELAKKEQVDRFARIAAPSGLLNGLNPGIINHVRNSKQVHSIIEALVRSKKTEDQLFENKKYNLIKCGANEASESNEQEEVCMLGMQQATDHMSFSKSVYRDEVVRGHGNSHKGNLALTKIPSLCNIGPEDHKLEPKLTSSVTVASENNSCLSNDESANLGSVNSLSIKAANVASHWLELLNQDVRGRLAALRRSKKRVRAVITTELPLLMSKELSPHSDLNQPNADAHSIRWSTLFAQMDKALSEEETHLENWLNQVKEMQMHCENGLYRSGFYYTSLQRGLIGHDSSIISDDSDKDLAVRAAAASIYSTCNFLLSAENSQCC